MSQVMKSEGRKNRDERLQKQKNSLLVGLFLQKPVQCHTADEGIEPKLTDSCASNDNVQQNLPKTHHIQVYTTTMVRLV